MNKLNNYYKKKFGEKIINTPHGTSSMMSNSSQINLGIQKERSETTKDRLSGGS